MLSKKCLTSFSRSGPFSVHCTSKLLDAKFDLNSEIFLSNYSSGHIFKPLKLENRFSKVGWCTDDLIVGAQEGNELNVYKVDLSRMSIDAEPEAVDPPSSALIAKETGLNGQNDCDESFDEIFKSGSVYDGIDQMESEFVQNVSCRSKSGITNLPNSDEDSFVHVERCSPISVAYSDKVGPSRPFCAFSYSGGRNLVAFGSCDILLLSLDTLKLFSSGLSYPGTITSLSFRENVSRVLCCSGSCGIFLFDLRQKKEILRIEKSASKVEFPDCLYYLSDDSLYFYDIIRNSEKLVSKDVSDFTIGDNFVYLTSGNMLSVAARTESNVMDVCEGAKYTASDKIFDVQTNKYNKNIISVSTVNDSVKYLNVSTTFNAAFYDVEMRSDGFKILRMDGRGSFILSGSSLMKISEPSVSDDVHKSGMFYDIMNGGDKREALIKGGDLFSYPVGGVEEYLEPKDANDVPKGLKIDCSDENVRNVVIGKLDDVKSVDLMPIRLLICSITKEKFVPSADDGALVLLFSSILNKDLDSLISNTSSESWNELVAFAITYCDILGVPLSECIECLLKKKPLTVGNVLTLHAISGDLRSYAQLRESVIKTPKNVFDHKRFMEEYSLVCNELERFEGGCDGVSDSKMLKEYRRCTRSLLNGCCADTLLPPENVIPNGDSKDFSQSGAAEQKSNGNTVECLASGGVLSQNISSVPRSDSDKILPPPRFPDSQSVSQASSDLLRKKPGSARPWPFSSPQGSSVLPPSSSTPNIIETYNPIPTPISNINLASAERELKRDSKSGISDLKNNINDGRVAYGIPSSASVSNLRSYASLKTHSRADSIQQQSFGIPPYNRQTANVEDLVPPPMPKTKAFQQTEQSDTQIGSNDERIPEERVRGLLSKFESLKDAAIKCGSANLFLKSRTLSSIKELSTFDPKFLSLKAFEKIESMISLADSLLAGDSPVNTERILSNASFVYSSIMKECEPDVGRWGRAIYSLADVLSYSRK